ncbi:hypothetical protein OVA07_11025 [Novosphingobium sp. SL115]|uniref:hypothetical protein n=1 Tax=Novosphingobium sp. SL115 TaxID=2995150 RepID=UPI002275DC82|nr:hypothetical protein [Novosphingobium sp. SL115]MCY1671541.1 hypothetical protein [Novosphingobium sp. SL115]
MEDVNPAFGTETNETPTLREKVDAARARLAERTGNARPVETVKGLIVEHPVASMAAGLLLGALIAKAIPSTRKRVASAQLGRSATGLAAVAGKFIADYAARAASAGRDGLHRAEEVGGAVGGRIAEGSGEAKRKAVDLAEVARSAALEASELAIRKVNEIASRMKH